jgi:CheY-like chemotaxis protein
MVETSSAAPGAGLTGTQPASSRDIRLHDEFFLGAKLVFPTKGFPGTCSQAAEREGMSMSERELMSLSPQAQGQSWSAESLGTPRASPRQYGILIADDEGCVRSVLNLGMRQSGFAVWLAANGQEAFDLYRRYRELIDVVLLDVQLPGADGPRTLAALQELNPRVRCCFMSGDLGAYTEEGLRDLGAVTVIPKPFRLAEVTQSEAELSPSGR